VQQPSDLVAASSPTRGAGPAFSNALWDGDRVTQQAQRRRTFAIISHPDAGKTTLTEKFLLYGGAVMEAGAVTARAGRPATGTFRKTPTEGWPPPTPPSWSWTSRRGSSRRRSSCSKYVEPVACRS
jgi:hypothetical protein